jgi:hypothetical protein
LIPQHQKGERAKTLVLNRYLRIPENNCQQHTKKENMAQTPTANHQAMKVVLLATASNRQANERNRILTPSD